jgi:Family of unknown function (DUF6502)
VIKKEILAAVGHVLRPLVRMLLRSSVTWEEFEAVGKEVFVQVAREDYGIQGRPTNTSRVALITGLSRREVTRIKGVLVGQRARGQAAPGRISQILTGWHLDPAFLDADGMPALLPATGDGPTMELLLRRYAGDSPFGAVIKEFEELGLVELTPAGYRVLAREYIRSPTDPDLVRQASVALHDHATTIAYNVDAKRTGPARFERMATHLSVPHERARAFEAYLQAEGQEFLKRVDGWLTSHADSGKEAQSDQADRKLRVGVGMYLIRDMKQMEQS